MSFGYFYVGLCMVRFGVVRFILNKFKSVSLKASEQPNRTERNGNIDRFGAPKFSVLAVRLIDLGSVWAQMMGFDINIKQNIKILLFRPKPNMLHL